MPVAGVTEDVQFQVALAELEPQSFRFARSLWFCVEVRAVTAP